ncbi:hypothetical protein ES288_D09G014600v1 [Gossypium darwinii]|uniref:Uncharacterized protein n=1 Tax=Gossypium darwinii TaxID=34276 RepID=A0A5D2B5X0_GOSDA|nr:hypothetical protein ES288_D09G014600v1 [Gossypium darwinii]
MNLVGFLIYLLISFYSCFQSFCLSTMARGNVPRHQRETKNLMMLLWRVRSLSVL